MEKKTRKKPENLDRGDELILRQFLDKHASNIDDKMCLDGVHVYLRRHKGEIDVKVGDRSLKRVLKKMGIKTRNRKRKRTVKSDTAQQTLPLEPQMPTATQTALLHVLQEINQRLGVSLSRADVRHEKVMESIQTLAKIVARDVSAAAPKLGTTTGIQSKPGAQEYPQQAKPAHPVPLT